ncbi:MAG: 8-oxo-dGTP diphosphatase MutT [Desulfobacteraceae bacterium]|nr:MAG: 8-oxo-dGTP diphosphatase MutT [Desulfobacteraceae bacterium]
MKNNKPHFEVAAALIRKNGKILITRRPPGSHLAGYWEFPGGKREEGETLPECLEREIREELGVGLKVGRLLHRVEHEYEGKSISLYLYECSAPDGEPVPIGCESLAWVAPGELDNFLMPPADREFLSLIRDPHHEEHEEVF